MIPTEELKQEHQGILLMLRILDRVAAKIESGEKTDVDHLEQIVEFLRVFADRCHHGKEEDLLFPAMEKAGIPRERGPIGVMLMEHEEGRGYIREMADALARNKKGESAGSAGFRQRRPAVPQPADASISRKKTRFFSPWASEFSPRMFRRRLSRGVRKNRGGKNREGHPRKIPPAPGRAGGKIPKVELWTFRNPLGREHCLNHGSARESRSTK